MRWLCWIAGAALVWFAWQKFNRLPVGSVVYGAQPGTLWPGIFVRDATEAQRGSMASAPTLSPGEFPRSVM